MTIRHRIYEPVYLVIHVSLVLYSGHQEEKLYQNMLTGVWKRCYL